MKTLGDSVFDKDILDRARGCLLGQLIGDAIGSQAEFTTASQIKQKYPDGLKDMFDGGRHKSLAGQGTDDWELCKMLIDSLLKTGTYNPIATLENYIYWLNSMPTDIGRRTQMSLEEAREIFARDDRELIQKYFKPESLDVSQANGALMRISPLAIFGCNCKLETLVRWAILDANLTHQNQICFDSNAVYVVALYTALNTGSAKLAYNTALKWAIDHEYSKPVINAIIKAKTELPMEFFKQMGWVLIALQNAFYYLYNEVPVEKTIINTIACGGDTDTTGAIAGALSGAVYGLSTIPERWVDTVLSCKPDKDNPNCKKPRPREFWATDIPELIDKLLLVGYNASLKES